MIVDPACKLAIIRVANNQAIYISGKKESMATKLYDTNVKIPFLQSIHDQLKSLVGDFNPTKN